MRIATLARIPVFLHWSFLGLVAAVLGWSLVTAGPLAAARAALLAGALFSSVVLHELGHALVARRYGIRTAHITLYPFGGVAALQRMPTDPVQELAIAVAGPLVNGALATVAVLAWATTGFGPFAVFAAMNVVMGLFNLIPAFPMDGGRVLRAALSMRLGYLRASRIAIGIGRAFAWVFIGVGVATTTWSLLVVGLFLHVALFAERARLQRARYAWRGPHGLRAARFPS